MSPFKKLLGLKSPQGPEKEAVATEETDSVAGDRGIASVNKSRSLQSRMSNLLALGLIAALGLGMLSWYYSQAWARQKSMKEEAHKAVKASASGDMALPPLGKIEAPTLVAAPPEGSAGDAPPLPAPAVPATPAVYMPGSAPASTNGVRTADRRLDGPVFQSLHAGAPGVIPVSTGVVPGVGAPLAPTAEGGVESLLKPTIATAVTAKVLSNQPLLLPKGAFIDCTLETAIDSSLPGLTTCITATDTFGADGKVVLLERGTKLVGETKGDVRQGTARIFVVWSEARTPAGVVVPLASPGTDELGRSGLPGSVDRHFMDRFGAALLVSVIEGAVQAAAQPKGGGAVIYNPSAATDVMTEVLKSTVNIPPTVRKQNGDRIQILVARDLDFRSVYELHARE